MILSTTVAGVTGALAEPPSPPPDLPPYAVSQAVTQPRLFAENVVSTPDDEIGGTFSPDGTEFYFTKLVSYTTFPRIGVICVTHYQNGKWTEPEILPFSGTYLDFPPKLSPDGKRMFFSSTRPHPTDQARAMRIWVADRTADGWSQPQPLDAPINAPGTRWNSDPSLTRDGTIYFSSDREKPGALHIYRSRLIDGKYAEPEKLGPAINSAFTEYQPYVSPDERILLFAAGPSIDPPYPHREEELETGGNPYPRSDLFVSVRINGEWTPARHLGHGINTFAEEEYPILTPDGRYLFFGSERSAFTVPVERRLGYDGLRRALNSTLNGHGNIFFVDAQAMELTQ